MLVVRREIEWCWRSLIKRPGYFVTAVLVLAIGVGAMTVLIAARRGVYGTRLPSRTGDRLVRIYTGASSASTADPRRFGRSSYPEIREYARQTGAFLRVFASARFAAQLGDDGGEASTGALVTSEYFRALNLRPLLGRLIEGEDDRRGGTANDVVISYDYWVARYGAATDVVGKLLRVNGHAFVIVGVTPASFHGTAFDYTPRFWVPVSTQADAFGTPWVVDFPDARLFDVLAELQPALALGQAQAALDRLPRLANQNGTPWYASRAATVETATHLLGSFERAQYQIDRAMTMLGIMAGLVLFIACANLTMLMIVRGLSRRRDIAVQCALGAARIHIVFHEVCEIALIAIPASVAGLGVAYVLRSALIAIPFLSQAPVDLRATDFITSATVAAGLAGLLLFLSGSRVPAGSWQPLLSGASSTAGGRAGLLRQALVAGQVGVALVVGFCAALLVESSVALRETNPGFTVDHILVAKVQLSMRDGFAPRSMAQYDDFMSRIRREPGVISVSSSYYQLLSNVEPRLPVSVPGHSFGAAEDSTVAFETVGVNYFSTLGMAVLGGRVFGMEDSIQAQPKIVINEAAASQYWPGASAIGKHIFGNGVAGEVIGIVNDVSFKTLRDAHSPRIYKSVRASAFAPQQQVIYVRMQSGSPTAERAVQRAVRDAAPGAPPVSVATLAAIRDTSIYPVVLLSYIVAGTAIVAMVLALVGIAGLVSYLVGLRTREIGIRIALGSDRGLVVRLIVQDALRLVAVGVTIGIAGALVVARATTAFLFGLSAVDPSTLAIAALTVAGTAVAASCLPAIRASRIDPLVALRSDT